MADDVFPILQIAPTYVDLDRETIGISNSVRQICLRLAARGWPVTLCCGDHQAGVRKGTPGVQRISDTLTRHVFAQRANPLLGPGGDVARAVRGLPDVPVAHVHTCFSAFTEAAMIALQRRGTPYLFTPRGKLSPGPLATRRTAKRLWWALKGRRAVLGAARIVISSDTETVPRSTLGLPEAVDVVPNGYEPFDVDAMRRIEPKIITEPTILFLGAIDPRKQPVLLVQAFAQSEAKTTHRLRFVGTDQFGHEGEVRAATARLGVADRVDFHGPAYGAEKHQILVESRCMVLASTGEGFPMVLCEAIGAGLPIITSPFCNFGVAARIGAGLEVPEFTPEAWASAIDTVCLDDAGRAAMVAACADLAPKITWDATIDQWIALYRRYARR
ncbi:MAG: glycosyltransferase [Phycisphaerales bacterium]|nr:glycosyltransferase [Phycisphaerales bacterium]